MKSIIEEIFYGDKGYWESIKSSAKYEEVNAELSCLCDNFCKELSEEQIIKFKEIEDKFCQSEMEADLVHYKEGIKIGILLGLEVLQ